MSDPTAALKALTKETKALIVASEFEARRMPVFQLRSVLQAIVNDDEERKLVIDMVEKDLRAAGHSADQVMAFLSDLLAAPTASKSLELGQSVQATRRLRSPFSRGFDDTGGALPAPVTAPPPPITPPGGKAANPAAPAAAIPQNLPPPDARPESVSTRLHLRSSNASSSPPASSLPSAANIAAAHGAAAIPTPPTGTPRRNAFAFVSPQPADSTPQAQGSVPVGAMAWRLQQSFGNKPGTAAAAASGNSGNRPLILLADDDKRIRMVFRLRLEEAGMAVFECDNGLEAWERLQKGDLAAAVLDMKMPGLHGLEVLSHLTDKGLTIPIVICSAYDQLQDEFVIKTYPHLRYLVKPVAPENLITAIRELLAGKPR